MNSAWVRRWIGAVWVLAAMGCSTTPLGPNLTFVDSWQVGQTDTDTYYTMFPLSHGVEPGTLEVRVDDDPVPESSTDGYTYEGDVHVIEFHGIWMPERGATITATYRIAAGT